MVDISSGFPAAFNKANPSIVAFAAATSQTLVTSQEMWVSVAGLLRKFVSGTAVQMPTLTAGTDYAIYACNDGTLRADASFAAATGFDAATSRQIGGFHYAPGSNAAARAGGDTTPQINPYSIWDLRFRPSCPDPRGMALVAGRFWCDIYLLGVDHHINGTSRGAATIADGSSPPKVPTLFGGDGSATYGNLTWFSAMEVMKAAGKDLLDYAEFAAATYGATEGTGRGNDPVTTGLGTTNAGSSNADQKFTSKWGVVQASGCLWVWGRDLISKIGGADYAAAIAFGWKNNTGSRGQMYLQGSEGIAAALLGGSWGLGASCGSRASDWFNAAWNSLHNIGARGRGDHLTHV